MVDNTILGYAILDYFAEKDLDVLDAYIPLFCKAIMAENIKTVDRDTMKHIVTERYGLKSITLGAVDSILKRMVSSDYLKRDHHELCVNDSKIIKFNEEHPETEIEQDYENLIHSISKYAIETFEETYNLEDIGKALMVFIDAHGAEMILDKEKTVTTLKKQKVKKQINYIISSYVLYAYEKNYSDLKVLLRLSKGRIIARVVTLSEFDSYIGRLDKVQIALDAPIIFNLLGLNGDSGYNLTVELLNILKENGAKFIVFNNNYREITNTLNNAIWRLRTHNWEYDKSSRVLKYAIRNHLSAYFIQTKLSQVDSLLESLRIEKIDAPQYPDKYKEIDIERLTDIISRKYSNNGEIELDESQQDRIATDVDSISYIFRIRGNSPAINLKRCKAILVTNNAAISYASNDGKLSAIRHNIPACVTDVFLSTILWTAYPGKKSDLNDKILLCECASNMLLDDDIIKSYYKKVYQLNKQNRITKEQVLILTSTNIAMNLLEKYTLNDPERYTDETPEEILREIEERQNRKITNADIKLKKLSHTLAIVFYWIIWMVITFIFALKFIDYSKWCSTLNISLSILQAVTAFWGVLSWGGIIWSKINIISTIEQYLYKSMHSQLFNKG